MRKLLNTLYITNEKAYLSLDGENFVCSIEDQKDFRIPFDNIEAVVCFSYVGCSPAVMGKCNEKMVPISFISPSGKFLTKVSGETKGNVFLRVSQIDKFRQENVSLAQNTVAAKLANSVSLIKRSMHDNAVLRSDEAILKAIKSLKAGIDNVYRANDISSVLGIEGNCAHNYFSVFGKLIKNKSFSFTERNKRPPLDEVNAVLSLVYTLLVNEYASALETVGLDSCIGFYHTLRSGRPSLACDLVEEVRCIAERFVLTLINLSILNVHDFERQMSGAVLLNDSGRKKVIGKWQEKKRNVIEHPVLKQKIQMGLIPYVQANLFSKYLRGEIEEYPCYIVR